MRVRYYVLYRLPNLKFLDSRPVKSKEKEEAQRVGAHMKIVVPSSEEMVSETCFTMIKCYGAISEYCTGPT